MNQEQVKQNQPQEPQGWKDVQLDGNAPLNVLVSFLNVLNQRLCGLEDNVFIKTDDGKMLSLTEIYEKQAEAQAKAEAEAQKKKEENK